MVNGKKRPSKKKAEIDTGELLCASENNISIILEEQVSPQEDTDTDLKKRGRKPKGGKLVSKTENENEKNLPLVNVILHLKCSLKDLDEYNATMKKKITNPLTYNPEVPPEIMAYKPNEQIGAFSLYEQIQNKDVNYAYADESNLKKEPSSDQLCAKCSVCINGDQDINDTDDVNIKDVNQKLKRLKSNLYKNALGDKKSACFWCTCDFDNQPCYIPKFENDGNLCGYGSFCRPECAVAFLMKENIDDSTKFERYHLLNKTYSKVYDFKKNIKPAPNPYYLLDKFFGNLSIQEYRKLLKTEHMLLVIDKPLTRILPELHEDTDDFINGIYGGNKGSATQAGGVYKVKRQSEKQQGPSKSSIMRDQFGISQ